MKRNDTMLLVGVGIVAYLFLKSRSTSGYTISSPAMNLPGATGATGIIGGLLNDIGNIFGGSNNGSQTQQVLPGGDIGPVYQETLPGGDVGPVYDQPVYDNTDTVNDYA